jgi:6-phosphofructokinase 2
VLTNLLQQQGIEHHSIPIQNWTRENVTVLDESTGKQFRFVMPGAELSAEEADRCLAALAGCQPKPQYLVASGSLPPGVEPEFFAKLARLAERLGSRLVVDTSGPALREAAAAGAYLLKPNLRELGELAGRELHDEDKQAQAAQELVRSHQCEIVVVSLGAGGVLVADGSGARRCRTPTVPVKSKVGAGDSMVAGLVLGLARGQSLQEAVLFGLAAGAAAVMTPGTELCRREDTERLFDRLQRDAA